MLNAEMLAGHLSVVRSAVEAVVGADFVFLCVETPQGVDGAADPSYIESVAAEIGPSLKHGATIVNKSTVPPGALKSVQEILGRADVAVVSNPEFLREGTAIADSLAPDRIVAGGDSREAAIQVTELFSKTRAPVLITDATTSELIKYASNAFLALKLTFINSMANLCDAVGADVADLAFGVGSDKRIGFEYLRPGPGWGGSCLPKDATALLAIAHRAGTEAQIVQAAIDGNVTHMARLVQTIESAVGGSLRGRSIAVLGLTFKALTGDRRDSPAVWITQRLQALGATINAYDPTVVPGDDASDLRHISIFGNAYEATAGADAVIVLTEWDEFRFLDFERVHHLVASPIIVDARNLLDSQWLRRVGYTYIGIGQR